MMDCVMHLPADEPASEWVDPRHVLVPSHIHQHDSCFCEQSDGNAPESERVVKECSVKSFEQAHSGRANASDRNSIMMMSMKDCETEPGTMF